MRYLLNSVYLWLCIVSLVASNKLSYQEWYDNVWKKWKDAGYVTKKPFECQTKQAFGKKGVIETPNFPKHYPNNADCTWVIETPQEYTEIHVRMLHFNVENVRWSKLCIKDSLEVFQYRGDLKEKKGRYCGKHSAKEFTVYGNKMEFRFMSNQYRARKGFHIEWEAVKGCGGVIKDESSGKLTLPKSMKTEKLFHCTWEIHAPKGQNKFTLDLEKLHLPNKGHENCRKTSLEVIDSNDQVLSKFCSSLKTQKTMTIHGKVIRIRVRLSRKTKRTAFRASWEASTRKLPKPYTGQCGRPYVDIAPQNMMRDIQLNEQRHRRARRLVGGTPVSRGEWPWIVQIQTTLITKHFTTQTITCGGVIVSPTHIITAAHCVSRDNEEVIQHDLILGAVSESHSTPKRLYIDPRQIIIHPKFNINKGSGKPQNDIAIIKLKEKLDFGYDIQPVCLPSAKKDKTDNDCHFAGWGKTSENSLHSKRVNTIQARLWGHCDRSPSVLCATYDGKKAGACKGDSGSPLICTRKNGSKYLVGVLSYGGRTCPSMVDGHMDVRYYMDWIVNVMQNDSSINS